MVGGAGGSGSGDVPRNREILVESIATTISIISGIAISRVARPARSRIPPRISRPATKEAVTAGSGMPSFVKRPTPWLARTNLRMPSQRKTEPAMIRRSSVAPGAVSGRTAAQERSVWRAT